MRSSSKKRASFLGFIALFLIFIAVFSVFSSLSKSLYSEPRSTLEDTEFPTVIIDAGHGGEDGGASSASGLIEKHLNLEISCILRDMLEKAGVEEGDTVSVYDIEFEYVR